MVDIAIFIPAFYAGGIERMMVPAGGFAERAVMVDLVLTKPRVTIWHLYRERKLEDRE